MSYELKENNSGLPTIVVNGNIFFSWDPAESFYDLFISRVNAVGLEPFAQLLAKDHNTAFTIFCNG